jgi:hypothetical protein
MGCVLNKLAVSSSRFDFTNSNYNYDNSNTYVSFHLCSTLSINPARMAKNNSHPERALVTKVNGIF